jgi:hypothetical protein
MNFKDINLRKVNKEDLIRCLLNGDFVEPSVSDKKEIQKTIIKSIEKGNYLLARNSLILGIFFEFQHTFSNIRKKGVFRYSRYISKKCIIKNLASELIEINERFEYNDEEIKKYLKSIINLSALDSTYKKINELIVTEIRLFRSKYEGKSLIKTLLSYLDFLFLSNFYPKRITEPMELSSRTKEEISSAVSYLIFLVSEKQLLTNDDSKIISEEFIETREIGRLIIPACFIIDYREFEVLVDNFNYECILFGEKLKIIPPSEDFEKSIRLGFLKEEIQFYNDLINVEESDENNSITLERFVDELNKEIEFDFFEYTEENNYPRYRVKIPDPIYDFIIENFFKPDNLFEEEIIYLAKIFKEQLLNPRDIKNIEVRSSFTLMDFIKIKRIFSLFYLLFSKQIYNLPQADKNLIYRSLIPTYTEETFYEFIEKLTFREKIDEFLDIVCWEPGMDILFDLQYHPILFINGFFMIPLSVFVNSNSIRNLFASEYKHDNENLFKDGSKDELVNKLNKDFENVGIRSYKQTNIPKTDIDLFAIYDNTIFLFECKQTLHPVNVFDLRTTYDYIKKAEKQLDYINQLFSNGGLIPILESKYSIDLKQIKKAVSSIVISNRLFNGNVFKYPIRYYSEIDNFLNNGTIRTKEGEFWLWKSDKLSLSDLLDYFSINSELVNLSYEALSVKTIEYKLAEKPIVYDFYYLDFEKSQPLVDEYTSKLRKVKNDSN